MGTIVNAEIVDDKPAVRDIRIGQANSLYDYTRQEEQAAEIHQRNAIMAGLQLGYLLVTLKQDTPQGKWMPLFSDADKRLQSPNALRASSDNYAHVRNFNFGVSTANRYMSCYRKAVERLAEGQERSRLDSLLGTAGAQEIVANPHYQDSRELLSRATGGAETPRQMMLNLGVIKAPAVSGAPGIGGKTPQYETILANRNTQGRPPKPALTPEQEAAALQTTLAAVPSEDKMAEMAARDTKHILDHLDEFMMDGLSAYLIRDERKWFADKLREYASKITQ